MTYYKHLRAVAGLALIVSSPVAAATQGTLGASSTGSVTINASVPNRVQISGLTDISLLNSDPSTAASSAENVCVYSNTPTKGYNITATGSGSGSAFTLANAALTVPYSVQWAGSSGQTSGTGLSTGTALTGLTSTATNPTCGAGPASTASLIVSIASTDLQGMRAATTYTGTLTLVVAPE